MLTTHLTQKLSDLIPKNAPFGIAFSGGGDSTALVHALRDHPQAKHVYIVDHDLRRGSNAESIAARDFAVTCGYDSKLLKWNHNSPITALQEKARKARYGLMGEQCRKDRIKYLLTAHSEDDQAETLLMRYDRKTDWRGAAGMAEVTYGPVWPELAMVNVVRPLLGTTRQELRDYNREHDLKWAEDPSNQNRNYARIRARDYLGMRNYLREDLLETARDLQLCLHEEKSLLRQQFSELGHIDTHGIITLSAIPLPELMFHCLRVAGGQAGSIDKVQVKSLLTQMRDGSFKSATLGGTLIAKYKVGFVICRDPVAVKGREDSRHERRELINRLGLRLCGFPQIWDGRFSVTGPKHRNYMGAVHQNYEFLSDEHKQALKEVPTVARLTLPVSKHENDVRALGHYDSGSRTIKSLIRPRLEAALGGKLE